MRIAIYLPLLAPVLAALVAGPVAERLRPRVAVWMVTAAAVVLACAALAALALLAAAGLAQLPAFAALQGYSLRLLHEHDPASPALGVPAALLLAGGLANAVRVAWGRLLALAAAADQAARLPAGGEVVVTDDDAYDAYAVPGLPGRIVISSAMLDVLTAPERAVLLAHERAHLRRRHVLFVSLARCAAAAVPVLIPLQRVVEFSVERWADELAATATGDRRGAAIAIAKAALATGGRRGSMPAAALGIGGGSAGPVPRRVAALLAPPRPSEPVAAALAVAGLILAVACAAEGARDLHALFVLAGLLH
ncbi:MAG: M56 family metallopeptidase [Amnibacterium sp.]